MNGFRSFGNIVVILLIFTLMMVVIGGLAKGASSGAVDPEMLAFGVTAFIILVIGGAFAAALRSFRRHGEHMKQASSADILAEIMAMKDDEPKKDEEDGKHED